MDHTRLLNKFRPEGQFNVIAHLLLILRVWGAFQLTLIPLNCLTSLSLRFHYHQILTYELWTSDEVINANIMVALSLLLLAPYLVYYEHEKSGRVIDFYLTVGFMHCLAVLAYNWTLQWQFVLFVMAVAFTTSLLGYLLALKHDQDQFVALVSGLERTPKKTGVVPCEQHKTLVEPQDEFITVETLK